MSPVNDGFMSGSLDHSVRMWDLRVNVCQVGFQIFVCPIDNRLCFTVICTMSYMQHCSIFDMVVFIFSHSKIGFFFGVLRKWLGLICCKWSVISLCTCRRKLDEFFNTIFLVIETVQHKFSTKVKECYRILEACPESLNCFFFLGSDVCLLM